MKPRLMSVAGATAYQFSRELDWQAAGACVTGERIDRDQADAFFPLGRPLKSVKALCATCPVAQACLEYAIAAELEGIWGGTTTKEREAMRHAS